MKNETKRDKGLMIVSTAIILVGMITLFLESTYGIITTISGGGMFLMGYLTKSTSEKIE